MAISKVTACGKHLLREGFSLGKDEDSEGKCYCCFDTLFSFTHKCPAGNGSARHSHKVPASFLTWSFAQTEAVLSSDPTPAPPLSGLRASATPQHGSFVQQIVDAVDARNFVLAKTLLVEFLPTLTKPLAQRGFGLYVDCFT